MICTDYDLSSRMIAESSDFEPLSHAWSARAWMSITTLNEWQKYLVFHELV